MEILSGLEAIPDPRLRDPVVTWGVFDGVHRGHRRVLDTVVGWARDKGVPAVVITFDRHPSEVLTGRPVPMVSPLAERLRLISETGIDFCLILNFTLEFSRTSAEAFIRDIVGERLRARGIVLGHDSRFGRDRAGDLEVLESIGRDLGIDVKRCEPDSRNGRPVSSSLVREAILGGRLDEARALLGRSPSVFGTGIPGARRGTGIGFPTANLRLSNAVRPPAGVYAAEVRVGETEYRGVVNVGRRPTFEEGGAEMVEVHLLDYPGGDLYGRVLEVRFLDRVREEKKFDSADALVEQIRRDVEFVRNR